MGLLGPPDIVRLEARRRIPGLWNEGLHRRSLAAAALGRFRDPRAVEPLLACLERHHDVVRDFHTRCAAAESLGAMKDARAIPGLEAALSDENEEVRRSARMALSAIVGAGERS